MGKVDPVVERLSPAEFGERFKESFRTFWCVAVGIVNDSALAEDVVQEAAVSALERLDQFEPGSNFKAWMCQFVRFTGANHRRKKYRRQAIPLEPEITGQHAAIDGGQAEPAGLTSDGKLPEGQSMFDDRVVAALETISDTARACLLLRTLEDLSYDEIAGVLGVPKGTAMSHVHRARQQLRQRLAPQQPGVVDAQGEEP